MRLNEKGMLAISLSTAFVGLIMVITAATRDEFWLGVFGFVLACAGYSGCQDIQKEKP